jgi:hypothetical protein
MKLKCPFLPLGLEDEVSIARELNTIGFGFISFSPPRGLITRVMEGWNKFLSIPYEQRISWRCGDPADWDDGYVPRQKGESCPGCGECALQDDKHFFHYRPHLTALLDHKHVDFGDRVEWIDDLNTLFTFCRDAFHEVTMRLDAHYPEFDFAARFKSTVAESRHVLRLLSYNRQMLPGELLGKYHIDRNFGTIQVHETHPALVLTLPDRRINYVPKPGKALVFTGGKAAAITNSRLSGIRHGVVVPDSFKPEPVQKPRQSIVFFAHIYPEIA